jgi:hypothetical protein
MEVHLDSTEAAMSRRDHKGKRRRPQGRTAATPAEVAAQTGRILADREAEWLGRSARDPASFAAVEREVHDEARRQADLYVAVRLKKKAPPGGPPSGRPGDHGDDPLLLAPRPHRQGAR